MAAIVFLAFCNPTVSPVLVAFGALLVATASATQDIVIDAFRVESLDAQRTGRRHGVLCRGLSRRHAGFDRRRALSRERLRMGWASARTAPGPPATSPWRRLSLLGIVTTLLATEPAASNLAVRGPCRTRQSAAARRCGGARGVLRIPHPRHGDRRARLCRAVQVLRRLRRRHDRAVRHRSRLHPQRLRHHREVRRLRRDPDRRLCRRHRGARLSAGDQPLDRRVPADVLEPGVHLAGLRRPGLHRARDAPSRSRISLARSAP